MTPLTNTNNVVENDGQPSEGLPSSTKIKTIITVVLPIFAAIGCFVALPFVSSVGGAIGIALTGLAFITLGISCMLTGDGYTMFKAWAEERQREVEKEKSKEKPNNSQPSEEHDSLEDV